MSISLSTASKFLSGSLAGLVIALGIGLSFPAGAEPPQWEQTLPALRIQVDARRNRVWVLNEDAVYVYDIAQRSLVKRIELPGWTIARDVYICAPDLAVASSGAVLVTSNVLPTLWEIDPGTFAVRQHKLATDADADKDVGFTGLAFGRRDRELFGVSSQLGSVWRIDLAAGKAQKVRLSAPVHRACSLTATNQAGPTVEGDALVLCASGPRTSLRVALTRDRKVGRTTEAPCDL